MPNHADAVLSRVRSLVRDDVLDALAVSSRASRRFILDVTVTQTVAFTVDYRAGAGRLSGEVERVPAGADLESVAASRLHAATGDAARLLRHWADRHADYRARLRAQDCVETAAPVGTQFRCNPCQGGGRIVCDHCAGKKRVTCPAPFCHGKGQWVCTDCDGYGNRRCGPCSGSGSVQRSETVWERDQSGNSVSRSQWVRDTCGSCHGAGSSRCTACSSGWVYCGRCHRSGIVDCPKCSCEWGHRLSRLRGNRRAPSHGVHPLRRPARGPVRGRGRRPRGPRRGGPHRVRRVGRTRSADSP